MHYDSRVHVEADSSHQLCSHFKATCTVLVKGSCWSSHAVLLRKGATLDLSSVVEDHLGLGLQVALTAVLSQMLQCDAQFELLLNVTGDCDLMRFDLQNTS